MFCFPLVVAFPHCLCCCCCCCGWYCCCCCCLGWCNFLLVIFVSLCYAFSSNWNLIEMFVICGRQPSSNRTLSHTFCCCQISAPTSSLLSLSLSLLRLSLRPQLICLTFVPRPLSTAAVSSSVLSFNLPFSPFPLLLPHFWLCFVYLLCGLLPLLLCAQLDV